MSGREQALEGALRKAESVLWMAEQYAIGGGTHGPEMREYKVAAEAVDAALAGRSKPDYKAREEALEHEGLEDAKDAIRIVEYGECGAQLEIVDTGLWVSMVRNIDTAFRNASTQPETLRALVDLREACAEAYKAGRIDAEAFVRAGNVIAKADRA